MIMRNIDFCQDHDMGAWLDFRFTDLLLNSPFLNHFIDFASARNFR